MSAAPSSERGQTRRRKQVPGWRKNPLSRRIFNIWIPKSLEKPLKLDNSYNETREDEHIEYVDNMLDYHHVQIVVRCKLFVLTLKEAVMKWFKTLPDGNSYKELFDFLTA